MNYIYCITNLINNKRYVGKTTQSVEERFQEHCQDSVKKRCEKRPLYDAMNKYGIENFKVECLEEVEDESILSEREIYWIDKLQTYGKDGYNATKGGDGKILYDYREIIEIYSLGYNIKQTAEKVGCCEDTVQNVLRSHGVKIRGGTGKPVDCFDKAGNHVETFMNTFEAADWLVEIGKSKNRHSASNHIIDCCVGKCRSCGGYRWVYKNLPN